MDEIYSCGYLNEDRLEYYDNELSKAENRPSDDGFLSGSCDNTKHLYGVNGAGVTHDYVAYVHGYDDKRGIALIEVKNVFARYDDIEVFGPDVDNERFKVEFMFDDKWNEVERANKPTQLLYIRMPFKVHKGDMFRRIAL